MAPLTFLFYECDVFKCVIMSSMWLLLSIDEVEIMVAHERIIWHSIVDDFKFFTELYICTHHEFSLEFGS